MGLAPPRSIRRIPAGLLPRRSALGSPEPLCRAPPAGALTCAAAANLRAPGSALRKLRPGPLPQPRPGGRGPRPRPANQEPPSDARGQSSPCRPAPGERRKHSRGIPPPRPALPDPPRRRGAVDLPTPPKAATGCTTAERGGGTWGWAPANREEGRPATNGKLGPLDHVLLAECRPGVSGVVRGGRAGRGSQVTRAKFRAEANSPHPEKLTL